MLLFFLEQTDLYAQMGSPPELHNPPHTTTTHTHTHTASPPVQCVENAPVSNLADLPQNLTSLARQHSVHPENFYQQQYKSNISCPYLIFVTGATGIPV